MEHKLEIPNTRYKRWGTDEEKQAHRDERSAFEDSVKALFVGFPDGWERDVKFKWSDSFFIIKDNDYPTTTFKRAGLGKTLVLTDEKIAEIRGIVERVQARRKADTDHWELYERLDALLTPLCDQYLSEYGRRSKLALDSKTLVLQYASQDSVIKIGRDGVITAPQSYLSQPTKTLQDAEDFIAKYSAKFQAIRKEMDEIKAKIPAEYFTEDTNHQQA